MSETQKLIAEFSDHLLRAADALRSSQDEQSKAKAVVDFIRFEREYDGLILDHYDP